MIKYKLMENGVKDQETGACIPAAPGNRHWNAYQEWLKEGNTPEPEYTPEELEAHQWAKIRANRDAELGSTDFLVLADVWDSYSTKDRGDLKAYRQGLRDVPASATQPDKVVWPEIPPVAIGKVHRKVALIEPAEKLS